MKMAKPSPADIKAAEELHQVLQLIDARFGGPFSIPETGQCLSTLLHDGLDAFDSDNLTHLQTLYNHLARLLRTAPNFYGRVIGGMLWVIMNEANEILDPAADVIELHPRFGQLRAECEKLRGLTPEPPPRPPEGQGLPRYGLRWTGPGIPLSVPMDDGYWTPWHLAEAATVAPGSVAITAAQLQSIHRDLDACQKVIWLAGTGPHGFGFDPAYVNDAKARLGEIEALLVTAAATEAAPHG
jgi:hypothetical protein